MARPRVISMEAERFEGELHDYLLGELKSLRAAVPVDDLAKALASATDAEIFRIVDMGGMREIFSGIDSVLFRGASAGAKIADKDLGRWATLDATRPRIKAWLRDHSAELVKQTVGTSKEAVRTIIQAGVEMGRHPRRLAEDVRGVVGLTDPQAVAVARRREYLLGQDMPASRANALADKYADQQLGLRARTIARNESMVAINQGRASLWEQLSEDGALPAKQMQAWDSANDGARCPLCAKMHGQKRAIGDPFKAPDGTEVLAPPLHVQCRCVVNLL